MKSQVRVHRLLSVLFVLSLVVTCFVCTDTSSADDTVLASIDPVEFGDTGAEAAANKINTAAGESVCIYHNGTLTFTKSVTITSKNKLSDQNLITFSSIAEQKIEINEGVKVELLYDVASVGTNYCGAIYAAHNLTIGGSGNLVIQVKADSYSDRLCGIVAKGQFTVKNNSLSIGAANYASVNHFAGIYYTSNCICFNGLNCSINAHDYAIYLAGTGDVIFESHYCTAKYIGNQKAIHSVSGKLDIDYKGTEIQASNYITG